MTFAYEGNFTNGKLERLCELHERTQSNNHIQKNYMWITQIFGTADAARLLL